MDINYEPISTSPLFGGGQTENSRSSSCCDWVFAIITSLVIFITTVRAFIPHPVGIDIFFAVCILMIAFSHVVLILWYRVGDLDPKFKTLLYYNAVTTVLICICANVYFHHKFVEV